MATDFFQQQDAARRSTGRLVVLFGLAVLAIVASIWVLLAAVMGYLGRDPETNAIDWTALGDDPSLLIVAFVGALAVIGGGSLYKIAQLRGGGRVVAEQLGGRLVNGDTSDPVERRLLNVVEEMAIASGTSTPPVYLMDAETGINAFAAGFAPQDAVIGVTRGAATTLDRDELQGVIAHEFSHILNGDMRLNIRLMGLLHGIFVIGMIGYFILRVSFYTGGGRSRDSKGALPILALGAGLAFVGFAGTFFGNLIKAAVSRQREFLADSSAVQFTRQPEGIAGALKKIGGFVTGSQVENPNAPQASHMFFGRATAGVQAMFSTHPPLRERIKRIDPSWDGGFPKLAPQVVDALEAATAPAIAGFVEAEAEGSTGSDIAGAVDHVGQPTSAHIAFAGALVDRLPDGLVAAAHEPYGARALVYALLLDRDEGPRRLQLAHLEAAADDGVYEETVKLARLVEQLDPTMRLPLLEIALPALCALTPWQYELFRKNLVELVEADETLDLFEWSLQRILLRDMQGRFGRSGPERVRHRSLRAVQSPLAVLLSVLAYVGNRDPHAAAHAFGRAWQVLTLPETRLRGHEECGFAELDAALAELDRAAPMVKKSVLEAAVACITADRQVTVEEAELLRAVSASISCPMPPILMDDDGV